MNGRRIMIVIGRENAPSGIATPIQFSSSPIRRSCRYSGRLATVSGNSSPTRNSV